MNQEIVLAVSIGICLLSYLFGILTGRVAASHAGREQLETLRNEVFKQRRVSHQVEQQRNNARAELANLQRLHSTLLARKRHDHYTLVRAGHALTLASKTFTALQAKDHALTAQQLSTALFGMADSAAPTAQADRYEVDLPNQCEESEAAA